MNNALFTSNSCEWETPISLFKQLDNKYHFDIDVCATAQNTKCERFYTKEQDGLQQKWTGRCWMNPPYGKEIGKWVKKAFDSVSGGGVRPCMLPNSFPDRYGLVA